MATITIKLPLIPDRVITVPDNKLADISKYYGVSAAEYETTAEALAALADNLVWIIKRPVVQGRGTELSANPDISDLIQ